MKTASSPSPAARLALGRPGAHASASAPGSPYKQYLFLFLGPPEAQEDSCTWQTCPVISSLRGPWVARGGGIISGAHLGQVCLSLHQRLGSYPLYKERLINFKGLSSKMSLAFTVCFCPLIKERFFSLFAFLEIR